MTGTCTPGGWVWWVRSYRQHRADETKTTKELFDLYIKGVKWEDA